ncbi:adenine nucleotide translocase lysine N-methyltransferase isoform X2 [Syngnathoides biaculeatus]|uniref:adenine nucleotide translocase lysine N-methyltransferase isoform X2 n=1 Tax=Syngnathoides biaculeatus TaxID=300417 RepID=UPI002ADD4FE6|nr:adenine nucleotide translocase lysine N-methyltransferase isoform X2 [Syngnathoides biaculeatus]
MEDSIDVILQDCDTLLPASGPHPVLSACTGALFTGLYGLWSLFAMPAFRKVPLNLKVPYLPCSRDQTLNIMKLLEGRTGRLADLGSGDGRLNLWRAIICTPKGSDESHHVVLRSGPRSSFCDLQVFAASSAGFKCTGFEINSILVAYARSKARWSGVPSSHATFFKKDFWKTDLSQYNNVTAFLAPGAMAALREKLLKELPDAACVVSSRYPFPGWSHQATLGSGLNQAWAYDVGAVRSGLRAKTRVP